MEKCGNETIRSLRKCDPHDEGIRLCVGTVGLEADVVGAGIGVLRDPGEGPARYAAKSRALKKGVSRDGIVAELGGEGENDWGSARSVGAERIRGGDNRGRCNP